MKRSTVVALSWLVACSAFVLPAFGRAADLRIAVAADASHADRAVGPATASPAGAGPALAAWLAKQRVGTLIAGDFGERLAPALQARRSRMVEATGVAEMTVREAL